MKSVRSGTFCLLLVGASLARAQVEIPDTPVGRNVSAMLGALNSRDRNIVAEYVADYGRGESVDTVMRTAEQIGTLTLVEIIGSEPLRMQFVIRTATGLQLVAFLEVEDADPPRVAFSLPWTPVPPGARVLGFDIDASVRLQVIEGLTSRLSQFYVIEETAQEMVAAIAQHQRDGDYDNARNGWVFANRLTQDLQAISRDKHLLVSFSPVANGPPVRSPNAIEPSPASLANCGFGESEMLADNVGYVKINQFVDPGRCGAKAIEVLTPLVGANALIFDLRDAIGGHAGMVTLLLGQLFSEPVELSAIHVREPASVQQLRMGAAVPGLNFATTPLYVLTSTRTFSAAEWLAYELQTLKRALIVGETTMGGAHIVRPERIDERFGVNLPYGQPLSPVTASNWEGVGVRPDRAVAEGAALAEVLKLSGPQ